VVALLLAALGVAANPSPHGSGSASAEISKVKIGERVLATDPQTGVTKAQPVV
jgi:hypothetical protein